MEKKLNFEPYFDKINDVLAKKKQLPLNTQERTFLHWKFIECLKMYRNTLETRNDLSEYAIGKQLEHNLAEVTAGFLNNVRK